MNQSYEANYSFFPEQMCQKYCKIKIILSKYNNIVYLYLYNHNK